MHLLLVRFLTLTGADAENYVRDGYITELCFSLDQIPLDYRELS